MDKLTPKQQRFCLLIIEGETQAKAYELAGYSVKSTQVAAVNANQLLRTPKVANFIAERQALIAKRTLITVESLTEDLIGIRAKAVAAGSFGPAVQATIVIARLHGLMVEKSEVSVMHRPAPLPTRILELSEADWVRQFGQGLQQRRLEKLDHLKHLARKKS